jgi:hypothetical protein
VALMGWRETLGAAVLDSEPLPNIPKTPKTPEGAPDHEPVAGGFGSSGGFGYQGEILNAPRATRAEALPAALAEAGKGLPVTVAELLEAFGAEGATDWAEGYGPHCRPEFLRAFAVAVAERLTRERTPEPEPEPEPETPPNPLEGLALLREDWQFTEARTRGRRNREALLHGYAERWRVAADAEPVEHRKASACRRAANAWLREAGR